MANKMKKFLAWIMVLTLLAGQLAIPAAADTTEAPAAEPEVTVEVSLDIPEAPAAEPQAPAPSPSTTVTTSEPVTSSAPASDAGVTESSTSTTTDWSGSEGGTTTSGSETTTTVTGTDDTTGQTLYEGGTTSGSESSVTTTPEEVVETWTEEGNVNKEIIVTQESEETLGGETKTTTGNETSEVTGGTAWTGDEEDIVEGDFVADPERTEEKEETTTTILGEEVLPEGGVTITMTPDTTTEDPTDFTGTVNGEIIPLTEDGIPEGAEPVTDDDGNVIGYKLVTTTEKITGTTENEGEAVKDEANSVTDTTADTSAATPDLDTTAQKLGVHIDDNTQIEEETDSEGKVTAYVITNTKEETTQVEDLQEVSRPEAGEFDQADGSVITVTVEDVTDADGNVIGYKSTTVKTKNGVELNRSETSQIIIEPELPAAAAPVTTYTLPQKPAESTTMVDGVTTTVTVSEIRDNAGKVIGYKSTTVKTDADGKELYREENDLYGTEETITESVTSANPGVEVTGTIKTTTTETTRITAEETTYNDIAAYKRLNEIVNEMTVEKNSQVVMIDGKLYYIYSGSMTVSEGEGHGDITGLTPIAPQDSLLKANDRTLNNLDLNGPTNYSESEMENSNVNIPADGFRFVGNGLRSTLGIKYDGGNTNANQFRLTNAAGEVYYALCVDLDTNAQPGYFYDIVDITSQDYFQSNGNANVESAEKIRSIALNGYWGTADDATSNNDVGSLDEVKGLVKAYLLAQGKTEAQANSIIGALTPGQALAATQAALWTYGAKNDRDESPINADNIVYNDSGTDETMVQYVYDALIAAANDENAELAENEGVEFLDAEDITGGSITLKSKVVSADEAHVNNDDDPTNDTYNTDIGFTLGIEPSKLNGDLIVTVMVGDNEVKKVRLAGEDALFALGRITADENGVYTITDIELAPGVNVTLNLSGTQNIGTGVYVYTSEVKTEKQWTIWGWKEVEKPSQTFVGLATGSRTVNLEMNMTFNVEEPTVTQTDSKTIEHGTRTDTQEQTKIDNVERKTITTKAEMNETKKTEMEAAKVYTADVTLTQVRTTETKAERNWKFSWMKFFEPETDEQDDDVPIDPPNPPVDPPADPPRDTRDVPRDDTPATPAKKVTLKKEMTIEDELVPLAKAPKTGDLSAIWLAISGMSLGGIALVNRKRKEEEE